MAYTKYSLTPANNNATPPDGAPEGMLPSAVNDTMRDMMAQIRDVGDGIRGGTYTMTAPVITGGSITGVALSGNTFTNPVITGGSINNTPIGASTANTGAFTTLSATGATTFSGATVVSGSLTANTFSSSGATITGGTISGVTLSATSPTFTTPVLGTPTSGTLTNCTGLPISTGVSGLGSNVATFLATPSSANLASAVTDETGTGALVFANSPTLTTPNLGTPSAATLTNATGLPISTGVSGLGTGVATFLATPSSANLAAAVTNETGSGALVFATSPTLVTPNIGVATGTSFQGIIGNVTPAAGTFTDLNSNGNTTLGDATSDTITANGRFNTNLVPSTDNARDLGTSALRWKDAYFSGVLVANYVYASNLPAVGSFTWNSGTSSPAAAVNVGSTVVTSIHAGMRRCVINDSGVVQYYLSATDTTKKADGTNANLDGTDGQVMVQIPKFYTRREVSGTFTTWSISAVPLTGFTLHPAFTKNGVEVDYRYYSAYDACYLDATDSTYKSGLNLDDLTSSLDLAADKLSSVSGVYPIVGVTRAECRSLAANRGTGWRQLDWALFSAVQLLYLIEYQSFYSQNITGAGNTNGSYLSSSVNQNDSPHTVAGSSNSLGNGSTNTSSGAGVSAKPGTSFMSYRGIENFYGNCWNWVDGVIVNPDGTAAAGAGDWWFTNNSADFSDSVRTNMTQIMSTAPTTSNYVSAIASVDNFFIATSVSGGSSATYLTDYYYGSTSADRVVVVGGAAFSGAAAGAFVVRADLVSSVSDRAIGARLAF